MSKDELIAELRAALEPLATEPLKDELPTNNRLCDLSDGDMDAMIRRARKAMELTSDPYPSIH